MLLLAKVISGGQTGADIAGIKAAKRAGLQTGGTLPRGFRTQDGYRPIYKELYGMNEHVDSSYGPRTAENVKNSTGTIRLARHWDSAGEILTLKCIKKHKKPYFDCDLTRLPDIDDLILWLHTNNVEILNIAGNSEATSPGIESIVEPFLYSLFTKVSIVQHELRKHD